MPSKNKWLALGYNIPINPSKNRVYVWRKLKEFGAAYFKQGVAVLPNTPKNASRFLQLAGKITEMKGEATMVELQFLTPADENEMIAKFKTQTESDYHELLMDCLSLLDDIKQSHKEAGQQGEELKKLVKRYDKVKDRDHFKSGPSNEMEKGLNEIINAVKWSGGEIGNQLKKVLGMK